MQVNLTDIYIDDEDEYRAIEITLDALEYVYDVTSARWMWLDEEWTRYVIAKVQLKKQLRKLKANVEYNYTVTD
jgi:hypothetical protein